MIRGKAQYDDVYIAASADGQREALELIKQGCDSKYISTGLNFTVITAAQSCSW